MSKRVPATDNKRHLCLHVVNVVKETCSCSDLGKDYGVLQNNYIDRFVVSQGTRTEVYWVNCACLRDLDTVFFAKPQISYNFTFIQVQLKSTLVTMLCFCSGWV